MKKFEGYIRLDLKVAPVVMALNESDAEDRFYELTVEELLQSVIDVSTIDVYSVSALE